MTPPFTIGETARYIALGDSVSIDLYPSNDLVDRGRLPRRSASHEVGAPSLLYRNVDMLWPEFAGRDLRSHNPDMRFSNLAQDGADVDSVRVQVDALRGDWDGSPSLITLTVGGNDLLVAYHAAPAGDLGPQVRAIVETLDGIIEDLVSLEPLPRVLVGTVYDPTDGTGLMPGYQEPLPLEYLHTFNDHIRSYDGVAGVRVADIHQHFLGHGVSLPREEDRYYWSGLIIEPSAIGASEVRRVWLELVEEF